MTENQDASCQQRLSECDVVSLSVPNPFFEGRNQVYLIQSEPITLIDTGIATEKGFAALTHELQSRGVNVEDIRRVILTHKHIDHMGNAWRFQRGSDAQIFIHESEQQALTKVDPTGANYQELVLDCADRWHLPREILQQKTGSTASSKWRWDVEPAEATPLVEGQRLAQGDHQLEVIHTPGHTLGSICLRLRHCLFSGDHVLPDLSPNVGGGDLRNRSMLRKFLDSLNRVTHRMPRDIVVAPGHGEPFTGLHTRCGELVTHHEERLDKIVDLLRNSNALTAFELAQRLFGDMRDFHIVLGCAEAESHLEYLEEEGSVAASEGRYRLAM